jgi:hypothetical protein
MRSTPIIVAIFALALGACSKGGVTAKNESAESVAKKVAASDLKPNPGRWQTTMKIEKMDMPGMTPQMQESLKKSSAMAQSIYTCLTPEQVNRPDAGFFGAHQSGCTYQHFTMAGGQIDAELTCNRGAVQMHMTMQGTYSPDSYSVRVINQGEMGPGRTMSTTMAMEAHRVGNCNGTEEK